LGRGWCYSIKRQLIEGKVLGWKKKINVKGPTKGIGKDVLTSRRDTHEKISGKETSRVTEPRLAKGNNWQGDAAKEKGPFGYKNAANLAANGELQTMHRENGWTPDKTVRKQRRTIGLITQCY